MGHSRSLCSSYFLFHSIRVSKAHPAAPSGRWHTRFVQTAFARWRGDSKIVEASAEHDFCFPRLIGMSRATECAQIFCAICQTGLPDGLFDARIFIGKALKCSSGSPDIAQPPKPFCNLLFFKRRITHYHGIRLPLRGDLPHAEFRKPVHPYPCVCRRLCQLPFLPA